MTQREIAGRKVGAIGLGCMGMSFAYGPSDEAESLRVLERSLELGCDHWDTADMYGAGDNELLLGKALKTCRDRVFLATKFANVFDRSLTSHRDLVSSMAPMIVDATPAYINKCIDKSLERLDTDHVDLYYLHRVDDRVPIEETVGAMARLVEQGKVKHLGLSEVGPDTLRRAHKVHPIAAVQMEYSIWARDIEHDTIPAARELGVAVVAYSPLGRGFLTGAYGSLDDFDKGDVRRNHPRFTDGNFEKNKEIVRRIDQIAQAHGTESSQVALAWLLAQGEDVLPIPGTKRLKWLEQNIAADGQRLDAAELASLDGFTTSGDRYNAAGMAFVKR
ncbi:MAG: aldo/keto reductase [Armatimonadetes bacterium]|nr:aldo/keto reductase [Armatimonadota bacterium]